MDKQYLVTVPSYQRINDVIIYEFKIQDTITNKVYICNFRFKDLQDYHKKLCDKKLDVPEFPKTHFWRKTNKDPKLIQERRLQLEAYFDAILNDPLIRGHSEIKHFIRVCKDERDRNARCRSQSPKTRDTNSVRKVKSLQRTKTTLFVQSKKIAKYVK